MNETVYDFVGECEWSKIIETCTICGKEYKNRHSWEIISHGTDANVENKNTGMYYNVNSDKAYANFIICDCRARDPDGNRHMNEEHADYECEFYFHLWSSGSVTTICPGDEDPVAHGYFWNLWFY